ncbi:MAG: CvpA family protein [Bacteroidota bacterium]|jgi:membrane protein required for colicin V production
MAIDVICILFYALGIYKGLSKGLLAALLTLIGYFIALILAIRFGSTITQLVMDTFGISGAWIPYVSYLLLFLGVILIVRLFISLFNKGLALVMLGWLNKLGGVFFYLLLYTLILIIIFYLLSPIPFLKDRYLDHSIAYEMLHDKMTLLIRLWGRFWPSLTTSLTEMEQLLH